MISEAVRLKKLELAAIRAREHGLLARQLAASPLVQLLGTVVIAESAEAAGILSSRWAGALEGGLITMIAIQAVKDQGVIVGGSLAAGMGVGGAIGSLGDKAGLIDDIIHGGGLLGAPLKGLLPW